MRDVVFRPLGFFHFIDSADELCSAREIKVRKEVKKE